MNPRIENWEPWAVLGFFIAMGMLFPAVTPEEPLSRLLIALITFVFLAAWLLWPLSILHRVKTGAGFHKIKPFAWAVAVSAILAAGALLIADFLESPVSFGGVVLSLYLGSWVLMAVAFAQLAEGRKLKIFIFSFISLYFIPLGAFYLKSTANSASALMHRPAQLS